MKRKNYFYTALLLIASLFVFQSCSADSDNNKLEDPVSLAVNQQNINKKWLTTYYTFANDISSATKTAYQVSSVEIKLENGNYSLFDRYSKEKKEGTFSLEGNILTLVSADGENSTLLSVEDLTKSTMEISFLNHPHLKGVEVIAIK